MVPNADKSTARPNLGRRPSHSNPQPSDGDLQQLNQQASKTVVNFHMTGDGHRSLIFATDVEITKTGGMEHLPNSVLIELM